MSFLSHIRRLDWVVIGSSTALVAIGLLSIYSSSIGREDFTNFQKQALFLIIGLLLMLAISFIDYRLLRNNPYLLLFLYLIGVVALGGLLVFAQEIRGIQGWYRIGGISVDPIEFMKIVLILVMAKFFAYRHVEVYRIRHILLAGVYFAIPTILIVVQPDLGSAMLLMALWIVTLLVAGIKFKHFLAIVIIGLIVFSAAWTVAIQDYQKNRIIMCLEPEFYPLGIGWSQLQAKSAIGNGGVFGQGLGQGTQTQYGFLSEPQTDFIFAAIAEEFGLVLVLVMFLLLFILLWRILKIGLDAGSNFSRLFAAGLATIFIVQIGINIGMNLVLLPIIGLPLPLVSYGGSSLIMTSIGLGILQSIKTH